MKKIASILVILLIFISVSCDKKDKEQPVSDSDETSDSDIAVSDGDSKDEGQSVSDSGEASDSDIAVSDGDSETEEEIKGISCEDVVAGLNKNYTAGGDTQLLREFILRTPENMDSKEKWPVVFSFHGFGDDPENFENYLGQSEANNEIMPFILVVPKARNDKYSPPTAGFDWDIMNLTDGSAEVDLFDSLLECVDQRWGVDETRVYVTGFSAGAIAADTLGFLRSDKIASILTFSGAYFSNPDNKEDLGEFFGIKVSDFFSWGDDFKGNNKYPQVLVSGSEDSDTWGMTGFTIHFEHMAVFDANYLTEKGHNVILCNHGKDHSIAGLSAKDVVQFFYDHPLNTNESPYLKLERLPGGFAEICEIMTEPKEIEGDDSDAIEGDDSDAIEGDDSDATEGDDSEGN